MKLKSIFTLIIFNLITFSSQDLFADNKHRKTPLREVSITMDNLSLNDQEKIISVYKKFGVNGAFAHIKNEDINKYGKVKVLQGIKRYLECGFIVFNHTANHRNPNAETFDDFKKDVKDGEDLLDHAILETGSKQRKYFRFPYLSRGRGYRERRVIDSFLTAEGYTVAPITIDSMDWKFDISYRKAVQHDDKVKLQKIREQYFEFIKKEIRTQEGWSHSLLGRNFKHIFLVHGTRITIDNLEEILGLFEKIGYKFISLNEAMEDEAYKIDTIAECRSDKVCSSVHLSHISIIKKKQTSKEI